MRISELRSYFQNKLVELYPDFEIDAIFYTYIFSKFLINKVQFCLHPNFEVIVNEEDINRMRDGEPIQYILEETTFLGLPINVNNKVLIPRPETEELVHLIINSITCHYLPNCSLKILDIGTGSGAIAISLAKHFPYSEVFALDNSVAALEVAKQNAEKNNVFINFFKHDILEDNITFLPNEVDIIVSNPPYIPLKNKTSLPKNVVDFEPECALFVPDNNPLLFYKTITEKAKKILRREGFLFFETSELYHSDICQIISNLGFTDVQNSDDLNGKPRFVWGKKL